MHAANNKRTSSSSTAAGKHISSRRRRTARALKFPPFLLLLLLAVPLSFFLLGFASSVRSLPDINADHHPGPNPLAYSHRGRRKDLASDGQDFLRASRQQRQPSGDGNAGTGRSPQKRQRLRGGDARATSHRVVPPAADEIESEGGASPPLVGHRPHDGVVHVNPPPSGWPVPKLRDDETPGEGSSSSFETIVHPADPTNSTTMRVPKFWWVEGEGRRETVMGHDGPLMSRGAADAIGTYDTSDGKAAGSPESRTIFVTIASYRDYQCRNTVESVFSRARRPERIRVAVVDQIQKGEDVSCNEPIIPCEDDPHQALCRWKDRIDVFTMEARLAVGPVFARHIGHRMYRGEYYAMQIDAHVTFIADWDVDVISQMDSTGDEMAVLSHHPSDIKGSIDPKTGRSLRRARAIMCNTVFTKSHQGEYLYHLSQPERVPTIKGTPQLQPFWAAGFSFARGHFVVNVPYDLYQPMVFQGEETSIGLRSFTYGYDLYAPQRGVCFHTYALGENAAVRNKVPKFWEHSKLYLGAGVAGMKRLLGIIGMNPEVPPTAWNHAEENRYGIGNVRSVGKFYEVFGIDVNKKVCQKNLCSFVAFGQMHKDFVKHLRPDGMGIDYGHIDYKFHQDSVPEFSLTGK